MQPSIDTYLETVVPMQGGLNYSRSVIDVPAGNLSSCLNYESLDYNGYARIDGFDRFDGLVRPSAAQGRARTMVSVISLSSADYSAIAAGDRVVNVDGDFLGVLVVKIGTVNGSNYDVDLHIAEKFSGAIQPLTDIVLQTSTGDVTIPFVDVQESTLSVSENLDDIQDGYIAIRDQKKRLTQNRIAHGIHYFKQRTHLVADFESILVRQVPSTTTGQTAAGAIVPGDIIKSGTERVVVLDTQTVTGSIGSSGTGSSATGEAKVLYRRLDDVLGEDAPFSANEVVDIERNGSTISDVLQVVTSLSTAAPSTWAAGLYKSQSYGDYPADDANFGHWLSVEHPWEVSYKDGRNTTGQPPVELAKNYRLPGFGGEAEVEDSGYETAGAGVAGSNFVYGSLSDLDTEDSNRASVFANASGSITFGGSVELTNFDFSAIPENSVVTGVEVKIVARWNPTTAALPSGMGTIGSELLAVTKPYILGATLVGGNAPGQNKGSASLTVDSTTDQTIVLGGQSDKWGLDDLGLSTVQDAEFGVKIVVGRNATSAALANLEVVDVNQIVVKVYYTSPSTTYYFWNGVDDVKADVVKVHTAKGVWNDDADKAEGVLIVTNVTPVGSATRNNVSTGDEMRTAAAGGGTVVCDITSNMVVCATASLSQIIAEKSRYEIITANFYGDETWRAIYGCSGASRAFSYDGTYFQKIYTGLPDDKDKPRHIRAYKTSAGTAGALALAFSAGNVSFSVPGEPENFDGANGAIDISVSRKIVGLANMQGTTLGIFTNDGVFGIKGLAESADLFTVAAKVGVLEYTVQEAGSEVFYCDTYGVRSVSSTDVYGDFLSTPLSRNVSVWLQPRLRVASEDTQSATPGVVLCSTIVRSKNQYRVFFRDGWILTLTVKPEGPEFTTQRWAYSDSEGEGDEIEFVYVPIAICSEVDDNGNELLLFSHYADYAAATDAINSQERKRYVFSFDSGWSFDGEVIRASISPYYDFWDRVGGAKILNKVRTYGLSRGVGTIRLTTAKDLDVSSGLNAQDASLGYADTLLEDFRPVIGSMANVAARGLATRLIFAGSSDTVEPSHVLQSLFCKYTQVKGDF